MSSPRNALVWHHLGRKVLAGVVYAFLFALGGCISAGKPPETWPAPVRAEGEACPDLSGTYENAGIDANGKTASPLSLKVFPEAARTWTQSQVTNRDRFWIASHVTFVGPNKSGMKIEVWHGKKLLGTIERGGALGDGFSCNGGALRVSLPVTGEAAGGVFFDTFKEASIVRANDGSLLVKSSSLGVGLGFYIIPLAAGFETLARYSRIDGKDDVK